MTANAARKDAWNRSMMCLSRERKCFHIKGKKKRKSTTHFHLLIEYLIEHNKRPTNRKLEIS